jgi:SWI/SNF-related matrix-associated actin-dependent regulator 1 of chromatin subfamily A
VDVIKLITKGTIEEDILQLANTKLQLDEAVAGDEEASKQTENEVKKSLIQRLRKQLEQEDTVDGGTTEVKEEIDTGAPEGSSPAGETDVADIPYAGDMLSALPAALLAAAQSGSGSASPAGSLLRAEETPPATQSPTPLPTPPENIREQRSDIIMVDE